MNRPAMPSRPALTAITGILAICLGSPAWAQSTTPDQTTSSEIAETTSEERAGGDINNNADTGNMVDRSYQSVDNLVQSMRDLAAETQV